VTVTALVTIADVQQHLNLNPADMSHLTELEGFVAAATDVISGIVGDVVPTARVDTLDGGRSVVVLRHAPVVSVQMVTQYGAGPAVLVGQPLGGSYTAAGYTVDLAAGILTKRAASGAPIAFDHGAVTVAYTAGRDPVPGAIRLAALELVRTNYQSTQQAGRPVLAASVADDPFTGQPMGDWLPRKVEQLLGPYRRGPVVC